MYRLELARATVHDLYKIASFLDDVGAAYGLDASTLYHVKLAVDEACSNIFQHAYDNQAGRIEVECEVAQALCTVRIRDWGERFDPENYQAPDPSLPLAERPIGGLGLYFIHTLMDEVEYTFEAGAGNCLTLRKEIPG